MIDATVALLREGGYGRVSIEAIARRAGVARATIYRRWDNKALLVYEAVFTRTETAPLPDTGELRDDLRAVVGNLLAEFAAPEAVAALPGLLADFDAEERVRRAIREQFLPRAREYLGAVLERARDRGELDEDAPLDVVFDALAGAVFFRGSLAGEPLDDGLADRLVALTVRGVAAG